jgi:chromate transporter
MIRRELVDEEPWMSSGYFNRLLAVLQVLPGPEAHELCVHMGIRAKGRMGGILAGLGFMLPGFVLMLGIGWAYVTFSSLVAVLAGAFLGVQTAVVAIIVRAVQKIGAHILEDRWLWGIAIAGAVATLFSVAFWIVLIAAGVSYSLIKAGRRWWALAPLAAALALAFLLASQPDGQTVVEGLATGSSTAPSFLSMFWTGLMAGLLTFGGAYTAIPYVRADTVGRGLLDDGQFLDGMAFAGVIPAPLVIFITFVGFVVGGWTGAFAMTAGMFLPAFAFSLIFYERLEAAVADARLHNILAGVAAAVVGIIATTSLDLGWNTLQRVPSIPVAIAIFTAALLAVWFWKSRYAIVVILIAASIGGWILFRQ